MTTRHQLNQERRAAERAVHLDAIKSAVAFGTYRPSLQDLAIQRQAVFAEWIWHTELSACPNPEADRRHRRINTLMNFLVTSEPRGMTWEASATSPMIHCSECGFDYDATYNSVICNDGQHARLDESED